MYVFRHIISTSISKISTSIINTSIVLSGAEVWPQPHLMAVISVHLVRRSGDQALNLGLARDRAFRSAGRAVA